MSERKGWLARILGPQRSARHPTPHLFAFRLNGSSLQKQSVRDVSSTGAYLVTNEGLKAGSLIALSMQQDGPLEMDPNRRITTLARVARVAEDGVGLQFIDQKDPDGLRWVGLFEHLVERLSPGDVSTFLHMYSAIAFLSRICPGASEGFDQLFRGRLSNHKVTNAVGVAFDAQSLLSSESDLDAMWADPDLVIRVLEEASSCEEEWLRQDWAGVLATSCGPESSPDEHRQFIELFSRLTGVQVRLLAFISTRSIKALSEYGAFTAKPLECRIDELIASTGVREIHMERELDFLSDLGLLEKKQPTPPTLVLAGKTRVTPSYLGLQMYARSQGHRRALEEFYEKSAHSQQSQATGA